jgi:hypothetical protein
MSKSRRRLKSPGNKNRRGGSSLFFLIPAFARLKEQRRPAFCGRVTIKRGRKIRHFLYSLCPEKIGLWPEEFFIVLESGNSELIKEKLHEECKRKNNKEQYWIQRRRILCSNSRQMMISSCLTFG